jgi:hypothetical protein
VSTDFCPLKPIKMVELFDGRLTHEDDLPRA